MTSVILYPYTYTHGFNFRLREPMTMDTIVNIISWLKRLFGETHSFTFNANDYSIEFTSWPGVVVNMRGGQYKAVKILIKDSNSISSVDIINDWSTGTCGCVFYKALYGAPCWTREEVQYLYQAFQSEGLQCGTKHRPSEARLRTTTHSNFAKPLA